MTEALRTGWRLAVAPIAALLLLNASLVFENVWPTPYVRWGDRLSLELAVVVLAVTLAHRRASRTWRVLAAVWVVLVAGRYLGVTGPGLYGRDFNIYWDSRHLGNVAAMLVASTPWWLVAATIAGGFAALVTAYLLARLLLGAVAQAAAHRAPRLALTGLATATLGLYAGLHAVAPARLDAVFAEPVTPTYITQTRFALGLLGAGGAAGQALADGPALESDLGALAGADVLLLFVESYGAVAFERPELAAALASSRRELDAAIRDTGRRVISAYVDSPTFGASSWLAHLTLTTGLDVRDQYTYTALMASSRDTLVKSFRRRGYRTVALMPGMRQPWPEGAFYGFDRIYGRDALEYEGPEFGWWSIPDQYALAKLDALERSRDRRAPLFAIFPTSTTHAPFGPVAPYQTDWPRILTPEAFDAHEVEQALAATPDLSNLGQSYARAMGYEYRTLAGYLRAHRDDDVLLIAIGDHQPPAAVSGPDASWRVPVHVIGRQAPLLDDLIGQGFGEGLVPRRRSIAGMHQLTPMLLEAFARPDRLTAGPRAAARPRQTTRSAPPA